MTTPSGIRTLVAAAVLAVGGTLALAPAASAVTQASAESQFRAAGITWTSSGGCTTRSNPTCTSFDGIRQATIDGAITLHRASGVCADHHRRHRGRPRVRDLQPRHGYKLDFSRTTCLTGWIHGTYTYIGLRGDGAPMYRAASGNVYADEGSHWDVTYYTCGC